MKTFTIGRSSNNSIVLNYPQISGNHADIIVDDHGIIRLVDHSSNGTYVNGIKINNQSMEIKRGDNVMFANYAFLDWNKIVPDQPFQQPDNYPPTNYYKEESAGGFLIAGWIFAILGGLLGLIFGIIIATSKITLADGRKVYKYKVEHRRQGVIMAIIAFVFWISWMVISS